MSHSPTANDLMIVFYAYLWSVSQEVLDMYNLKGFIAFPIMTDNAVGKVAALGEISKDSLTYAKETGLYKNTRYQRTILHAFLSRDSVEGDLIVPDEYYLAALEIGELTFSLAHDGIISANRTQAIYDYQTEFEDRLDNIELGGMITNGDLWMPEWISFSLKDTQSFVRLWFSDESFSAQYDDYEYVFIPPIPNIDDFFLERSQVLRLLAENNVKRIVEQIDTVRGKNPYTLLRTEEYSWNDEISTDWTVMIYGRYGNDPDRIRQALIDWILENSSHSRDEWLDLFPDIFTPTEFILIPFWHRFAIPNQTIQSGLNSPTIPLGDAQEIAETLTAGIGYDYRYLMANSTIGQTPYRTLGFLAVASEANRNSVTNFLELYPDYIGLPLTSRDFGRLSDRTQCWTHMFLDLLKVGENMSEFTIIPPGYSRIVRNGITYAAKDFEGMIYLLATRQSVIQAMGVEGPYEPEFDPDEDTDNTLGVEARMVREHLMYELNPHITNSETLDLDNVQNANFLSIEDGAFNVESRLNLFTEFRTHANVPTDPHDVTPGQLGLSQIYDGVYMLSLDVTQRLDDAVEDLKNRLDDVNNS